MRCYFSPSVSAVDNEEMTSKENSPKKVEMTETEKEILGCNSMKAAILKGARLGKFEDEKELEKAKNMGDKELAEYVKAIIGEGNDD